LVYSADPVRCTVELNLYFLLFSSDLSQQFVQLSCVLGDLNTRNIMGN